MLVEIDMVLCGTWGRGLEWPQGIQRDGHLPGEVTGTAAVTQVSSITLESLNACSVLNWVHGSRTPCPRVA